MKALKLLPLFGLLALALTACHDSDKKADNSAPTTTGSADTAPSNQPPNLTRPAAPAAAPATGADPSLTSPNPASKP
jgi:hypothetical protein